MKRYLAITLSLAAMSGAALPGQEHPETDWPSTPIENQLRLAAKKDKAAKPLAWKQYEAQMTELFEQHAALRKRWRRHRPPPPPDLGSLALPVTYLAQLWFERELRIGPPRQYVLADALARCSDAAGIDLLLEHHDIETDPRYRGDPRFQNRRRYATAIVKSVTKSLPQERAQSVIQAQLARGPTVTGDSLLFRLLHRFRNELPTRLQTAGRDWLASYEQGPSNSDPERVWKLRFELGDAKDRDALIPHVLGEDLLYCLTVILHAPLPHARLAAALRDRQGHMSKHERSYLTTHMQCALALTDPEREITAFLKRVRELQQRLIDNKATRDEQTEHSRLLSALCDIDHEQAHQALRQFVQEQQLPWTDRCWALQKLILKTGSKAERAQAEQLRQWWLRTAPEGYRRQLQEALDYAQNGGK